MRALTFLSCLGLVACGAGPSDPPAVPEPPVPGSLTVVEGANQTAPAGTTLPIRILVELRDTRSRPIVGQQIVLTSDAFSDVDPRNPVTDSLGRVSAAWRPLTTAGRHGLRMLVWREGRIVLEDTVFATVVPGTVADVQFSVEIVQRHLGVAVDLAPFLVRASDGFDNTVIVSSLAVEAPPPFQVTGTTIVAAEEAETTATVRVNGRPFPLWVSYVHDLRTLVGGTGGWSCQSTPGALRSGGRWLVSQLTTFVVDSVTPGGPRGTLWTIHTTARHDQTYDDGSTALVENDPFELWVSVQHPGWWAPTGSTMLYNKTSDLPLAYRGNGPEQCSSWTGPGTHVPLTIVGP